ncbi:MAG TPA: capsid cement protein [Propionibacteriaceae bacterium]
MGDHLLKFKPGQAVTFTASTAVVGGNAVEVTGNRTVGVAAAAASTKTIGSAAHDAAINDLVIVHLSGPVDAFISAAAILAGAEVENATLGKVQTATTGRILGITLTAATAADQTVQVLRA